MQTSQAHHHFRCKKSLPACFQWRIVFIEGGYNNWSESAAMAYGQNVGAEAEVVTLKRLQSEKRQVKIQATQDLFKKFWSA
jgi:hypothetical protein